MASPLGTAPLGSSPEGLSAAAAAQAGAEDEGAAGTDTGAVGSGADLALVIAAAAPPGGVPGTAGYHMTVAATRPLVLLDYAHRPVPRCGSCGQALAAGLPGVRRLRCTGCRSAVYCCPNCQEVDWPAHQAACDRVRGARLIVMSKESAKYRTDVQAQKADEAFWKGKTLIDVVKAAFDGCAAAQFVLYTNIKLESFDSAGDWLRRSATQGFASAQCALADRYASSLCADCKETNCPHLMHHATFLYSFAADQGLLEAIPKVACCLREGSGVDIDLQRAASYLRIGVKLGDADSQHDLGLCYLRGEGVPQNRNSAARLFLDAAAAFHGKAIAELRKLNMRPPPNLKEGELAVPLIGGLAAQEAAVSAWDDKLDYLGGVQVRDAARRGDVAAQACLGEMYGDNDGLLWRCKNAAKGMATSQHDTGVDYFFGVMGEDGEGNRDYHEAARLFGLAADQGNPNSRTQLGHCYYDGLGVPEDRACAAHLFSLAALKYDRVAQRCLGLFHLDGDGGLPKDRAEAVRLLSCAAVQGDDEAVEKLRELEAEDAAAAADAARAAASMH